MNQLLEAMAGGQVANIPVAEELKLFGHSALIGAILMAVMVWASLRAKKDHGKSADVAEVLLNSSNVLFLSFGMTGVMMLVNNNLARAFAIGAAIALVRFRIKFDNKAIGMSLFYAVLTGMACGVNEVSMAYAIVAFFSIMQFSIAITTKLVEKKPKKIFAEVPTQPIVVVETNKTSQPTLVEV